MRFGCTRAVPTSTMGTPISSGCGAKFYWRIRSKIISFCFAPTTKSSCLKLNRRRRTAYPRHGSPPYRYPLPPYNLGHTRYYLGHLAGTVRGVPVAGGVDYDDDAAHGLEWAAAARQQRVGNAHHQCRRPAAHFTSVRKGFSPSFPVIFNLNKKCALTFMCY